MNIIRYFKELFWKKALVINSNKKTAEVEVNVQEVKKCSVITKETWFKVWDKVIDTKYNKEVIITETILNSMSTIKDRWIANQKV